MRRTFSVGRNVANFVLKEVAAVHEPRRLELVRVAPVLVVAGCAAFVAALAAASGGYFANSRIVPETLGVAAMNRLLGRDPESVFRAYYDGTRYSALRRTFARWQSAEILPEFRGATYFAFNRPLQRLYLRYEEWAMRTNRVDLATHYLIEALR